jgi:uncharacterized protein YegJ (DUF2314 family)
MANSQNPVITFSSDDPEMEQAAAKARKTFRYFWRELSWEHRRIVPGLQLAAVKGYFTDPESRPDAFDGEHMWLVDVQFDGREIYGTLINSPRTIQSVKEGDRVRIPGKRLTDWMYVQDGEEVFGGFTIDLMRSRMSDAERKQHDKAWGLDFGKVGIVNLVPPSYIGEATTKKRGLFGPFGKPSQEQQDYAKVAEAEHPMSVNMRGSLDQQLSTSPDFLSGADDFGMTLLHQLCLAGSLDGVDVCLSHGADVTQATANGLTPLALATSLGWSRVVKRLQAAGATK